MTILFVSTMSPHPSRLLNQRKYFSHGTPRTLIIPFTLATNYLKSDWGRGAGEVEILSSQRFFCGRLPVRNFFQFKLSRIFLVQERGPSGAVADNVWLLSKKRITMNNSRNSNNAFLAVIT